MFDQTAGVREGRCWLLLSERDYLLGDLESFDSQARTAVFLDYDEPHPDLVGKKLSYVYGYWPAYHVWMVAEPSWPWTRARVLNNQVVAEVFVAEESRDVEGQEVKTWIRVKDSTGSGKERFYPVIGGDPQKKLEEILATGWDHQHCELCLVSIDIGEDGYKDHGEHWVCECCYEKYVAIHDLSFLFE